MGSDLRSRIESNSIPVPEVGCWLWIGAQVNGYGMMKVTGRMHRAHRVSFSVFHGQEPGDMLVCHTCDTPSCVNPDHLFLGTQKQNMADRDRKGRGINGEKNGFSSLSETDVLAIRESKDRTPVLAERFGVCKQTINRVRSRQFWRHLP